MSNVTVKPLKVYGGCFDGRHRMITAAKSKKQAHEQMREFSRNLSYYHFIGYCSETGNDLELLLAYSQERSVWQQDTRKSDNEYVLLSPPAALVKQPHLNEPVRGSITLKPLIWRGDDESFSRAKSIIGDYVIEKARDGFSVIGPYSVIARNLVTFSSARSTALQDYEARILSAIEVSE